MAHFLMLLSHWTHVRNADLFLPLFSPQVYIKSYHTSRPSFSILYAPITSQSGKREIHLRPCCDPIFAMLGNLSCTGRNLVNLFYRHFISLLTRQNVLQIFRYFELKRKQLDYGTRQVAGALRKKIRKKRIINMNIITSNSKDSQILLTCRTTIRTGGKKTKKGDERSEPRGSLGREKGSGAWKHAFDIADPPFIN